MSDIKTKFEIYSSPKYLLYQENDWRAVTLNPDNKSCMVVIDGIRRGHELKPWDKMRILINWQDSVQRPARGYSPATGINLGCLETQWDVVKVQAKAWTDPQHEWRKWTFIPSCGLGKKIKNNGWFDMADADKAFQKLSDLLTETLGIQA